MNKAMQKQQKKTVILSITLVTFLVLSVNVFAELKDPTRPYGSLQLGLDDPTTIYNLNVEGIIIGKDKKMAIINGQRLSIGDKIMNIKVIDINSDTVRLQDETGPFAVSLVYSQIKTPVKNK
jgi:hypothetical protein